MKELLLHNKYSWSQILKMELLFGYNMTTSLLPEQVGLWFMVFNATFNNISVISWQSVLLLEETRVPGENQRPDASH